MTLLRPYSLIILVFLLSTKISHANDHLNLSVSNLSDGKKLAITIPSLQKTSVADTRYQFIKLGDAAGQTWSSIQANVMADELLENVLTSTDKDLKRQKVTAVYSDGLNKVNVDSLGKFDHLGVAETGYQVVEWGDAAGQTLPFIQANVMADELLENVLTSTDKDLKRQTVAAVYSDWLNNVDVDSLGKLGQLSVADTGYQLISSGVEASQMWSSIRAKE